MQILLLALPLAAILALLCEKLQERLRRRFERTPRLVWLVPPVLTGYFLLASAWTGPVSWELILIVLAYTAAPVLCASLMGPGKGDRPAAGDFLNVLLLWLPLEFPAGAAHLVAKHAQGFLHNVAYGVAILLGLILFLGFRSFGGMKYNLPRSGKDLGMAVAGFALVAPVLIVIGIWIGFIPLPHLPAASAGRMAWAAAVIFLATALPEEILFRSIIQNLLMQRFGSTLRMLIVASVIFGAAHLDNGPQALPNWRYMILATIAGLAYGRVFQKSSTVLASVALHAMVDWTKHFFF